MKHTSIQKGIVRTFGIVVVINIIIFALVIFGLIWGIKKINKHGLKGCVEKVWNGNNSK